MKKIGDHKCFDGIVLTYEHESNVLKCKMKFSIFLPQVSEKKNVPLITFLSGLTCNNENFITKAGAFKFASNLGLAIVIPDTSPRGTDVPDDKDSYDFGKGAGFYLDATQNPWRKNYQMESYIVQELNHLICDNFKVNYNRQGIFGHSMGGHGALTLYLKHPKIFQSVSAFSPIVAPSKVPWGQKAFARYLGPKSSLWDAHDACLLIEKIGDREHYPTILIDQGTDDDFLEDQLKPDLFKEACLKVNQKLNLRLQEGYDHSYYFIQTFIDEHIAHHAEILK